MGGTSAPNNQHAPSGGGSAPIDVAILNGDDIRPWVLLAAVCPMPVTLTLLMAVHPLPVIWLLLMAVHPLLATVAFPAAVRPP